MPAQTVPALDLPLVDGRTTADLSLGTGDQGRFTLLVFFRGLHCPVCRRQLIEVDQRLDDLRSAGIGRVVAVSMESAERSARIVEKWQLNDLPVAHDLSEEQARQWGLFISDGIKEGEPDRFSEPGLFILDSDGSLYWSSVASMPFGRPAIDDVIAGVKYAEDHSYPARGAA